LIGLSRQKRFILAEPAMEGERPAKQGMAQFEKDVLTPSRKTRDGVASTEPSMLAAGHGNAVPLQRRYTRFLISVANTDFLRRVRSGFEVGVEWF
jgi:hypothetical protein